MAGDVEQVAKISPRKIRLTGTTGEKIGGTVTVSSTEKYPFKVLDVRLSSGKNLVFDNKVETISGLQVNTISVNAVDAAEGRSIDWLLLRTDSQYLPMVRVRIDVNIKPAEPVEQPKS